MDYKEWNLEFTQKWDRRWFVRTNHQVRSNKPSGAFKRTIRCVWTNLFEYKNGFYKYSWQKLFVGTNCIVRSNELMLKVCIGYTQPLTQSLSYFSINRMFLSPLTKTLFSPIQNWSKSNSVQKLERLLSRSWKSATKERKRKEEKRSFLRLENQTRSSKFAGASSRQVHPRPRCYDSRWIRVEEFALWDSSFVIKPEK